MCRAFLSCAGCAVRQGVDDLVQAETGRLLPWRVFLEGFQEFTHIGLGRNQQVGAVQQPVDSRCWR